MTATSRRAALLSAPVLLWLCAFFALPVGALLLRGAVLDPAGTAAAAAAYVVDPWYRKVVLNSLTVATVTTLGALALAYPAAYFLARLGPGMQKLLMLATFLSLTLGAVIKTFGWTVLLRTNGPMNSVLLSLGVIEEPIRILFTETALFLGMVNIFMPFMLIPLYAAFRGIDPNLASAAQCLGATPLEAFRKVVLPLSLPGVAAGSGVVFSLAIGAYVTPTLLIGERYPTLSTTIARGYLFLRNETVAATASILLLSIAVAVLLLTGERRRRA